MKKKWCYWIISIVTASTFLLQSNLFVHAKSSFNGNITMETMFSKKNNSRFIDIIKKLITNFFKNPKEQLPMYQNNLQHNGVYYTKGVKKLHGVKWKHKTESFIYSTPVLYNNRIFFGGGDGYFYCLNKEDGVLIWKFKTQGTITSTAAISNSIVYFTSSDGYLYGINTDSASVSIKVQIRQGDNRNTTDPWDYYDSSPIIYKDKIFVGSDDGALYAMDKNTGSIEWIYRTSNVLRASPTVFNNYICFGAYDSCFYVLDSQTGKEIWKFTTLGDLNYELAEIMSTTAVYDNLAIFGSRDTFLYCLDLKQKKMKWRLSHGTSWVVSTPVIFNDTAYVGTSNYHTFEAVDVNTGSRNWEFYTRYNVFGAPALADGIIYFGETEVYKNSNIPCKLYALDIKTGKLLWSYLAPDGIRSSPLVDNGVIYFGCMDGYLYALY